MVGVVRKIEMALDWFGRIFVVLFCVSLVFAEVVQSPPCFAYVDFLAECAGICGDAGEMVCDLDGSIGSLDLNCVGNEVLHHVRLHVKVPVWLLNLNVLLTKKFLRKMSFSKT